MTDVKAFEAELAALRARHIESLPGRWKEIDDAWRGTPSSRERVIRALHRLSGSSGMFGLGAIAQAARSAEAQAQQEFHHRPAMEAALHAVRASIEAAVVVPRSVDLNGEAAAAVSPRVAFISAATRDRFGDALRSAGYEAVIEPGSLGTPNSEIAVVAASLEELSASEFAQTADLGTHGAPLAPRLAILPHDGFDARLEAVRANAHSVLVEPVSTRQLLEMVQDVGRGLHRQRPRVLLVDDDEQYGHELEAWLRVEGIECTAIPEPSRVLPVLRHMRPDVIVSDLHMPGCSGFELAAVIRQEPQFLSVPVIFLTADPRASTHREALRQEGDAFLEKRESLTTLVDLIRTKTQRSRLLESSIRRDGLTLLLSHVAFMERLEEELQAAARRGESGTLAMVDIDRFKTVNDQYGHATGDEVIRRIAFLLRQRLRTTDIVGRYGGEEFAVYFPGTGPTEAARVVDDLRRTFAAFVFDAGETRFTCSFSAGLVEVSCGADRTTALHAADQALYEAKRTGRDRVVVGA